MKLKVYQHKISFNVPRLHAYLNMTHCNMTNCHYASLATISIFDDIVRVS